MPDRSPIDQEWIKNYTDEFLKIASQFSEDSVMRATILRRVECVQDLVEAWQKRNIPIGERK